MDLEQLEREFDNKIMTLIERVEVNQIVIAPTAAEYKFKTKEEVDTYLTNHENKIRADNAICFHNVFKVESLLQEDENKDLENVFNKGFQFLDDKVNQLCQMGEDLYEINSMIRNALEVVDIEIKKMNYNSWAKRKKAFNTNNLFYIPIASQLVTYSKNHLEFDTYMHLINSNFIYRKNLLRELKYRLVDIFSKYLLLTDVEKIPVIKFHCKPIEICELIEALITSKYFSKPEDLKRLLMEVFQIDKKTYKDKKYLITEKQEGKSGFLRKLTNDFDSYVYPKNK